MTDFVVTGSGHSGTGWVSQALTRAGIACGHQEVYSLLVPVNEPRTERLAAQGGTLIGDAAWPAAAYLSDLTPGTVCAHLVRNPFHVVASIYGAGWLDKGVSGARLRVEEILPSVFDTPEGPERACRYWVEWNLLVETHMRQPLLFQVEQLSSDPVAFSQFARLLTGEDLPAELAAEALRLTPHDVAHKPRLPGRTTLALDHSGEWVGHLLTMGARYGYRTR